MRKAILIVGVSAFAVGPAWASQAKNSQDPSRILVHFRLPVDADFARFGAIESEIVNASEGVVRLGFTSPSQALRAQKKLEMDSDRVLSVSKNFLYRPAVHYSSHPLDDASGVAPLADGSELQLFSALLPGVQAAPTQVTFGVDPLAISDWSETAIRLPQTNIQPTQQSSLIAAVIDTGVDYNHEDLSGALWRSPNDPTEVGYDFVHGTNRPYDVVLFDLAGCAKDPVCSSGQDTSKYLVNPGHGTHCMGHVGAVTNNSVGIRGVGVGIRVMALKFIYDPGDQNAGQGDDAAAIQSIDFAIQNGVRVISASWGGRMTRQDAETSQLKNALIRAQQAGVIIVVAAGNDGIDQDADEEPSFPAAYNLDNMIVVAATDPNDQLASFSNYGAQSVHVAAPGVKIISTTVGNHYNNVIGTFTNAQGQAQEMDWDGTSMAAPIVAGAVATVWTQFPSETYQQIRSRILSSVRTVPALTGRVSTGGILNVQAALSAH